MPIFLLAWFFVLGQPARASTIPIEINTVWTKAQSPIVINDYIWLKSGVSLTIEPGVIVKHGIDGMLIISGKLTAIGTKAEPIIFTSIKDDANGGDTNADGAASAPAPGDWWYLNINLGGEASLDYVTIQYGGEYDQGGVKNYRGKLLINHSLIAKNSGGASNDRGLLIISNSSIYYNLSEFMPGQLVDWGVSNNGQAGIIVDAKNNWWGGAAGPCPWRQLLPAGVPIWQVDVRAICGDKPLVDLGVAYSPWLIASPDEPAAPDPVIIVPGILGSWNISGRWQIDPIFHTYDNLMEALIAAGYKEDSLGEAKPTLFTFPYDWRVDNNITAGLLKEKIQQVKEITGASQVDIIAHSMGGLVTRSYAQGSDYQNDIDQVIFLGTPHQGSPESYLKYEGGAFVEKWDWLKRYAFQIEAALNGYFDLVDYIRVKVPTVEQLLPVYDYLKDKQPDNSWQLRPYPLNYPQNIYLEDLNSHAGVDLLKQRVKITNIVSDLGASSTLNYLRVIADPDPSDNKWQSGYPENLDKNLDSLEKGNGDSTVPLASAASLTGVEVIETNNSNHENLPTVMQKEIIKALTGTAPDNYFNNKLTSTFKRWAFFRVYSPVDFAIIAPDGKKIGKDFASSTEINQIPDAFYSGFNSEAEFVLIPNPLDGEYKVELQGVDSGGEYTLANSLIDGDKEIEREFTGTIAPEQEREFTVDYTAAADNPISDLAPVDTVPPVITITSPLENSQYP
ncbi:MAG: hypothetical protein Q7R92_02985, partial [bacterium]|nr:hypothetical protein [bacterium]